MNEKFNQNLGCSGYLEAGGIPPPQKKQHNSCPPHFSGFRIRSIPLFHTLHVLALGEEVLWGQEQVFQQVSPSFPKVFQTFTKFSKSFSKFSQKFPRAAIPGREDGGDQRAFHGKPRHIYSRVKRRIGAPLTSTPRLHNSATARRIPARIASPGVSRPRTA